MKFLPDIIDNTSILDKTNENSCENAEMKVMFLRKFTHKYCEKACLSYYFYNHTRELPPFEKKNSYQELSKNRKRKSLENAYFSTLSRLTINGESGIRTHAPFRTNGFQDRLVMTTSISLHTISCLHFKRATEMQK